MKAYLITTGTVFALIVASHVLRFITEGGALREPFLWVLTLLAAGLSVWAFGLLRLSSAKR
jgi:cytochrome c oxidase subunit IV